MSAKDITDLSSLYQLKCASVPLDMQETMDSFLKAHPNIDREENQENISVDQTEDSVDEVVFRVCHETPNKQVFEALFPNEGTVDSKEFWVIYDSDNSNKDRKVKEVQLKNWPVSFTMKHAYTESELSLLFAELKALMY